jgi:hypothetical protein
VLVTFDLDFSDIRVYPPAGHHGIWVLRPRTKASRTHWLYYDPHCLFLRRRLHKDGCGLSSLNGFVFMNRW